jgi:transcriptional regulator with XRE-family HTH domain
MLKEAEFINQTGIVYLQENQGCATGEIVHGGIPSMRFPPVIFTDGTGEDVLNLPAPEAVSVRNTLPYPLFVKTTGAELLDYSKWLLFLACYATSAKTLTSYQPLSKLIDVTQARLQVQNAEQTPLSDKPSTDKESLSDRQTASLQAEQLRAMSGLRVEQLAAIFGVSRTTYHKWLSGSPLHESHREHLLEVLPLIEETAQRLESPSATSTWLLTPVLPGGRKPIEYLSERQYTIFRGFLLRLRTGQERFRPLPPSKRVYQERSQEEIEDALERLRPRTWRGLGENASEVAGGFAIEDDGE